jgi:hypothetical protein
MRSGGGVLLVSSLQLLVGLILLGVYEGYKVRSAPPPARPPALPLPCRMLATRPRPNAATPTFGWRGGGVGGGERRAPEHGPNLRHWPVAALTAVHAELTPWNWFSRSPVLEVLDEMPRRSDDDAKVFGPHFPPVLSSECASRRNTSTTYSWRHR